MARLCATCLEPVTPVNLCICPDDDPEPGDGQDGSDDEDAA
jgi:hypothetical protein